MASSTLNPALGRRSVRAETTSVPDEREQLARHLWKLAASSPEIRVFLCELTAAVGNLSGVATSGLWLQCPQSAVWTYLNGTGDLDDDLAIAHIAGLVREIQDVDRKSEECVPGSAATLTTHQWQTLLDMWRRKFSRLPPSLVDRYPSKVLSISIGSNQRACLALWGTTAAGEDANPFQLWLDQLLDEVCAAWMRIHSLKQEHSALRTLQLSPDVAIAGIDPQGRVIRWNLGAEQLLGWTEAEVLARPSRFLEPEDVLDLRSRAAACLIHLRSESLHRLSRRADGRQFWMELRLLPVAATTGGEILLLLSDRTSEVRALKQLRMAGELAEVAGHTDSLKQRLRSCLHSIARAGDWDSAELWEPAQQGWEQSVCWNAESKESPAASSSRSRQFLVEQAARERRIIHPAPQLALREQLGWTSRRETVNSSITAVPAVVSGTVRAVILLQSNTVPRTEQVEEDLRLAAAFLSLVFHAEELAGSVRDADAQLRQLRNMDAVGLFSGGIAHDFNNILGIILGNCELAAQRTREQETQELLSEIQAAGERAAGLTRRLLTFGRQRSSVPQPLNAHQQINSLQGMLSRLLGPQIQLALELDSTVPRIHLDPLEFEQLLLNLGANARDAMPQGGRLTIATNVMELSLSDLADNPQATPGEYLRLSLADTGSGMEAAALARIFEPFFTTKSPGAGTGLGLSVVARIVQQARGTIRVNSAPGAGTTFTILLPLARHELSTRVITSSPEQPPGGDETVLVVDDEPSLRGIVRNVLETAGYSVREAQDAGSALRTLEEPNSAIDLLLTDVMMPGPTGLHLAAAARGRSPELRLMLMSGNAAGDESLADLPLLPKPFTSDALLREVRRVLDVPLG